MAVIARVLGLSVLTAAVGASLGFTVSGKAPDASGVSLLLGCVGALIGSIAGAAGETVAALRQKPWT
jgi:hypothetical protein